MTDPLSRLSSALSDRYTIERELGAGGMATVYLAEDLKHHRKVAVKVLRPDLAAALGPERFLQEIEIAAKLNHPHILPLLDSGVAEAQLSDGPTAVPPYRRTAFMYYVMPYIEGLSLRDKLAREGELPIGDAVRILRDVVDALTEAHAHGVVHRDIKPENILLRGRHALVTDFGVAKAVSEATGREKLTTAGVALGTPAYMAPEQASADPHLDQRVDIYAVGAVAYELLTGRPVFMGTTPQMILSAHMTEPPQPVTKHRDTVPAALESVVMRCLEKRPADRWQSAEELLPQLEALATPSGGVTPTGMVPLGAVQLIRRKGLVGAGALLSVSVLAVLGWWLLTGRRATGADGAGSQIPIAVLVFESRGVGDGDAYLGDGIAEGINTQLSKVSGFEVKAHGSASKLSRDDYSYADIARQLGAAYLVHGTLRAFGDSVNITARLIDPESDGTRWAEEYTHEFTASTLFGVTRDVAERVAADLRVVLSTREQEQLTVVPTRNTDAYRAYQLGRFYWSRRTAASLRQAVQAFEQAIARDPGYALAHAGLAETYALFAPFYVTTSHDAFPRAKEAAQRALDLDSTLGQARTVLAWASFAYDRDWQTAERDFLHAIELSPDYATAHHWYAFYLAAMGRFDEFATEIFRAKELDPLSLIIAAQAAMPFQYAGEYDRAIELGREALRLDPTFPGSHLLLGQTYIWSGRTEEGIAQILEGISLLHGARDPDYLSALATGYARAGRSYEARSLLDELKRGTDERFTAGLIAEVHGALGESEHVLEWLERALEEHCWEIAFVNVNPQYDFMRSDRRFQDLLERVGFPQ